MSGGEQDELIKTCQLIYRSLLVEFRGKRSEEFFEGVRNALCGVIGKCLNVDYPFKELMSYQDETIN